MMTNAKGAERSAERRRELRRFILDNYLQGGADGDLRDDDLLFESGVIDSTGAIALILFLEERFGITVADEELFPRNFASVERMLDFVGRKTAGAEEAGKERAPWNSC